jgi:hypothetical protein
MTDAIIEELWRIKDGIAREYGGNVDAFVAHLKAQESVAGQRVVDLRARKIAEQRHPPDAQKDARG